MEDTIRTFFGSGVEDWLGRQHPADALDYEALQKALYEPITEFLASGGKRWRPKLMELSARMVGGHCSQELLLIPELIHNGSLMVDDVEDGSRLRRGIPAVHVRYGTAIAVNAGNYLYFLPMQILSESNLSAALKSALFQDMAKTMTEVHLGQATDIAWSHNHGNATEERYLTMCKLKTGCLAKLAARMGARIGGGSSEQIGALGTFGEKLGIAFQIMDDVKDITGQDGKEFGDDVQEGKRSLPVLYALDLSREKQELLDIINLREPRIDRALQIIKESGAVEKAEMKGKEMLANALQELGMFDKEAKQDITELVERLCQLPNRLSREENSSKALTKSSFSNSGQVFSKKSHSE